MSNAPRRLFGTDGVRGVANIHPMTAEVAMQLGRALAHLISAGNHRHRVIIGKDTRLSGYMLEQALAAGVMSMGVDVALLGPMPTPGIAHLTTSMRADAGAVISASHNPYEDNGIKFFFRDGFKLPDETEDRMTELVESNALDGVRPTASKIGRAVRLDDARGRYIEALKGTFPRELTLEGLTLVVDCANGAGYRVAPDVLSELGAKVISIGVEPDGKNINAKCGALHTDALRRSVVKHRAHLGLALDGDADRLVAVDERGTLIDGDAMMALCASELLRRGKLAKKTVVATVMSNLGLERNLHKMGVAVVRTKVGDRYVVDELRRGRFSFGGEQSGHLVFMEHATTGDGTLAALQLLAVVCRAGRNLSELVARFERVPQVLLNVRMKTRHGWPEFPLLKKTIAAVEKSLGKRGRVLVRASGTESKVRVLVEGPDEGDNAVYAERIANALRASESGADYEVAS